MLSMRLLVLLWKNWIVHRRHYFVTLFEVLSPIVLSLSLLYGISIISSKIPAETNVTNIHHNATTYELFDPVTDFSSRQLIMYAPNNSDTTRLMTTAFKYTNILRRRFPSERHIINEIKHYQPRSSLWGSVIFYNLNGNTLPSSLQYKLSVIDSEFHTIDSPQMTYYNQPIGDRLEDVSPYKTSGFLAIQILIDLAYIKIRRRNKGLAMPNVEIMVKRIPIPSFTWIDKEKSMDFSNIIPKTISVGFLLFFLVVIKRVVDEKNNGAKEIMKMMGMSTTSYWGSTFISNYIIAMIISVIITCIYLIPATKEGSLIRNSVSVFLIIVMLYCASCLIQCFLITILFTKSALAIMATVVLWLSTIDIFTIPAFLTTELFMKMIACLEPNIGIGLALATLFSHKLNGIDIGWGNIMEPLENSGDGLSVGLPMIMMLFSCALYALLLFYLDSVWPWQPGIPKPPLFFIDRLFRYHSQHAEEVSYSDVMVNSQYFEEEPSNLSPSVIIKHLTKVFGTIHKKIAVDNISLNMYPGQITALLGHNGAGKTTTMNMLTGIFPPASGTVIINGYDIVRNTNSARKKLGLCPQHSVLYDDLTVEEHLKLFAGLKNKRWWSIGEEITYLLTKLNLLEKANILSKNLSGGMRRKLSLANAIIGKPQILILDEPTTGLDPESRRGVWDLLEQLRSRCTILLTTHYMEEADALGDRIAIMAEGRLRCCGSSMFLKRIFGTGYHLRIEKGRDCQVNAITHLIRRYVPDANVTREVELEVIYSLLNDTQQFGQLFAELENSYERLGIRSCGVDITTMDDVFLKVGQMIEPIRTNEKDKIMTNKMGASSTSPLAKAPFRDRSPETLQQMKALFVKRAQYAKRNLLLLLFQIVLPFLIVLFFVQLDRTISLNKADTLKDEFSFEMCNKFKQRKYGLFYLANNTNDIQSLSRYYYYILKTQCVKPLNLSAVGDPEQYLLAIKNSDIRSYVKQYLVGASMMQNGRSYSLIAWFNGIHFHLDPMSINLVTNALLQFLTGDTDSKISITASLHTKSTQVSDDDFNSESTSFKSSSVTFVTLGLMFLSSSFVLFPVHERVSRAKLLQRMCGVSGAIFWLTNFCWDMFVHTCSSLIIVVPFLIECLTTVHISFHAVGGIFIMLFLYGLASIPFSYIMSFIVDVPSSGFSLLIILNMLFGTVSIPVMIVLIQNIPEDVRFQRTLWSLRLFPNFAATWGIKNIYYRNMDNLKCAGYQKQILLSKCIKMPVYLCCTKSVFIGDGYNSLPYYSWEDNAAGKDCVALFLMFFVWFGIVLLLEANIIPKCGVLITNIKCVKVLLRPPIKKQYSENSDVFSERQRVEDVVMSKSFREEALVTYKLTKDFYRLRAVNKLTFGVHKKECFGLLGVNGAGKTTTFRMLAGDLVPSKGNAYIQNADIRNNLRKFQMAIGYCPQFDALIDRLSARETLQLFAHLRGIPKNKVNGNVNKMIAMCDLKEFANKQTSTYSGGTKRKLSLAMALIGTPPIVLLDEPTSGVDPASRRKMWETLITLKDVSGTSFILSSHSMDECESLCNRIAIMVNGVFRCLGSMQSLKSKFGHGYTILAKLRDPLKLDEVKRHVEKEIQSAELQEEFRGVLRYYIPDTSLKWSRLFAVMESAKEEFELEDYLVSGTSLEQIFMTFAREQIRSEDDNVH